MLCRSEDRAAEAVDWIKEDSKDSEGGGGSVRFEKCNLGSVESVKKCAEKLNESLDKASTACRIRSCDQVLSYSF